MTTNKPIYRGKKILRYRLYSYELWGNRRDGFEVNNIFDTGHEFDIAVRGEVMNAGTMDEFVSFSPSDLQINRALGDRGLVYDGEAEDTLCAENKYGDPVQEIRFVGTVTKHANGNETVIHSFPETVYTHFATLQDHLDFCAKRLAERNVSNA